MTEKESLRVGWEVTEYKCPVCKSPLFSVTSAYNGIDVWCGQSIGVCPSQSVHGHAKNAKEAYEVIKQKFLAREDR